MGLLVFLPLIPEGFVGFMSASFKEDLGHLTDIYVPAISTCFLCTAGNVPRNCAGLEHEVK